MRFGDCLVTFLEYQAICCRASPTLATLARRVCYRCSELQHPIGGIQQDHAAETAHGCYLAPRVWVRWVHFMQKSNIPLAEGSGCQGLTPAWSRTLRLGAGQPSGSPVCEPPLKRSVRLAKVVPAQEALIPPADVLSREIIPALALGPRDVLYSGAVWRLGDATVTACMCWHHAASGLHPYVAAVAGC